VRAVSQEDDLVSTEMKNEAKEASVSGGRRTALARTSPASCDVAATMLARGYCDQSGTHLERMLRPRRRHL
jgi:hypothetical protein